jgi:hypothetical protein
MKNIIKKSIESMKINNLDPSGVGGNCFEIFGYDFLLDIDYNVYLIECNTNPCIEYSC